MTLTRYTRSGPPATTAALNDTGQTKLGSPVKKTPSVASDDSGEPKPLSAGAQSGSIELLVPIPDYENLVNGVLAKSIAQDSAKDMIIIPSDDIVVEIVPRELRTTKSSVPDVPADVSLPPYMGILFDFYKANWTVVTKKYDYLSGYPTHPFPFNTDSTSNLNQSFSDDAPAQKFEIDVWLPNPTVVTEEPESMSLTLSGQARSTHHKSVSTITHAPSIRGEHTTTILTSERGTGLRADKSMSLSSATSSTSVGSVTGVLGISTNGDVLTQLESEPVNLPLLNYVPGVTDVEAMNERQRNRYELLQTYNELDYGNQFPNEGRQLEREFREVSCRRIKVEGLELQTKFSQIEPFYMTVGLYDAGNNQRISETFHFDTNPEGISSLMTTHTDPSSLGQRAPCREAIFSITHASPDIYLVVRVDKVLEGDMADAADRYMNWKGKTTREYVAEFCSRLGRYRQPFGWTAIPLFNERSELDVGSVNKDDVVFNVMYRQDPEKLSDADLFASLNALKKSTVTKKNKVIPVQVHFRIRELIDDERPARCLSPSLLPVVPTLLPVDRKSSVRSTSNHPVSPTAKDRESVIREMAEFPQVPLTVPHLTCVHNLYVYPTQLNFNKGSMKARNLTVRVQLLSLDSALSPTEVDEPAHPLKALYPRAAHASNALFETAQYTAVAYHNRTPNFHDEMKIALPLPLTAQHHLLFTFYHISCKKQAKAEAPETLLGWSFLPLCTEQNHPINDGDYPLPIATSLGKGYLQHEDAHTRWLDNRKPLFTTRIQFQTSIYTQDPRLRSFLSVVHRSEPESESTVEAVIRDLSDAAPEELVRYCPLVLDELFGALCRISSSDVVGRNVFRGIANVVSIVHLETQRTRRPAAILSYVRFRFSNNNPAWTKHPYEEVLRHWLAMIQENDPDVKDVHKYAGFFFDVICKSIVVQLNFKKRLAGVVTAKKDEWFSDQFLSNLQTLVPEITQEVYRRSKTGLNLGKDLNESLAYFLVDCLTFLPKNLVFRLMESHISSFKITDSETLLGFKFDFLRIVCGYEHFVALNLPLGCYMDAPIDKISAMQRDFSKRHYLAGLMISEVSTMLNHKSEDARFKAISTLKNLFAKHNTDPRYQSALSRTRIASMYFPFVMVVCEHLGRLVDREKNPEALSLNERRAIFACLLFVLRYAGKQILLKWLRKENLPRYITFLEMLGATLNTFEYAGREKIIERLSSANKSTSVDAKRYIENMYKASPGHSFKEARNSLRHHGSIRSHAQPFSETRSQISVTDQAVGKDYLREVKFEGFLATETTAIVLDTWDVLVQELHEKHPDDDKSLQKLFELLTNMLDKNQSESMLLMMFVAVKCFIYKFTKQIFVAKNPFCSELCRILLKHSCSCLSSVREHSAGLLYLLMKKNFAYTKNNFTKVRIQTIVALSKLASKDDTFLRRSLATMKEYASTDPYSNSASFRQMVIELADLLFNILRDSVKMNMYRNDPEMIADMQYRIAHGYLNAPDLRLATLETLTSLHENASNFAEAALCVLQAAAMVSDYLVAIREPGYSGPAGSTAFRSCSPSLVTGGSFTEQYLSDEGVCQSSSFSEKGLIELLDKAYGLFRRAHLYEIAVETYKLAIPIYEKIKSYERLAELHGCLKTCYEDISKAIQSGKRILGTYYRVGFYGSKFESLDAKEFVYKERMVTQLSEICQRLSECYTQRFGKDFLMIQHSNKVDRTKLDPEKVYIQVTFVDPYFDSKELVARQTYFERMNDIKRFVFETPYTASGKAHGDVASQCKRKTIITTEQPFPYLKKRLSVVSREELDLTPLEVSIEAIYERCVKLKTSVEAKPPNAKNLQMVLQGSVRIQVNSGPLEIANVFLGEEGRCRYDTGQLQSLQHEFREFLRQCGLALELNKLLIKHDQIEYQEDLEEGYEELKVKLEPFLREITEADRKGVHSRSLTSPDAVKDVLSFVTLQAGSSKDTLLSDFFNT